MGDNRLARVVIAAAVAVGLAGLMAAPASAQSLTDRFKSLFGGKSDEPAAAAPGAPVEQDTGDRERAEPVEARHVAHAYEVTAGFRLPGRSALGRARTVHRVRARGSASIHSHSPILSRSRPGEGIADVAPGTRTGRST